MVTSYLETFGYNALEPQSFGLPVVSFDIAGPRDIVVNNNTGYLVRDEETFSKKLISLYEIKNKNPELFDKFKTAAYDNSNNKFDKSKIFKDLNDKLFENV